MDFVFGSRKGMKFSYVVQEGDRDVDGISVGPNALTLNGDTVRDADGWSVDLDLGEHAITDDVRHKVDGSVVNAAPQLSQSFAVYFLNRDGQPRDREPYTITLASESEVYLIATNTTDRASSSRIELFGNVAEQKDERLVASVSSLGMGAPCTYCVDQFSRFEPRQSQLPSMPRRSLSEGDRFTFHEDIYHHQVPATLRVINTDGTTTLAIWVADDSWGDCSHCVNEKLVNQFADRFLRPGSANDVYDWVTAIFGAPWGQHNEQHLIPPDYSDQFHILIYDIGPNAGGSYNPFNNMRTHPHSSERLMFYLNAPILHGIPTALSIAAHELQHVVYFYQKVVLAQRALAQNA